MKKEKLPGLFIGMVFFMIPVLLCGQGSVDYPRDTSFSVRSAYEKIIKEFPTAVPVKEFQELQINSARDVMYTQEGARELHLDIFWPGSNKNNKVPGIICIHGGGWASGNKSHLVPLAQHMAQKGYVAVSVEYRLSPEAKYPAGVYDIKTAIRWMKTHAEAYSMDTSRVVVLGTSAGATLATLVGTTPGNSLFQNNEPGMDVSDKVQAIINMDGILDFSDPAESGKDSDPAKPSAAARWFGSTFKENPDIWIEASPLTYVGKNTPPTLFINSALPRFHAGREAYLAILERNGTYSEVHTIPETPHPFWLFYPWFEEAVIYIKDFLDLAFDGDEV